MILRFVSIFACVILFFVVFPFVSLGQIYGEAVAVDEEAGIIYFSDEKGYLSVFDLNEKRTIQKIKFSDSVGLLQEIKAHPESGLVFLHVSMPGSSESIFFIFEKESGGSKKIFLKNSLSVGGGGAQFSFDKDRQKIYLVSNFSNKLQVIDLLEGTALSEADLGPYRYPLAIKLDLPRERIYVLDARQKALLFLDVNSQEIIKEIRLSAEPNFMAMDEPGGRLFVGSRIGNKIFAVNLNDGAIEKEIPVEAGSGMMVFEKDLKKLWVVSDETGVLTIFDPDLSEKKINLGEFANYSSGPFRIYDAPARIYVLNCFTGSVFVVDKAEEEIIKKIKIQGFPLRITGWERKNVVYILKRSAPQIVSLDGDDFSISALIGEEADDKQIFSSPQAIKLDSQSIFVTNLAGDSVVVLDAATKAVVKKIPVGLSPVGVSINTGLKKLYTVNRGDDTVSLVDLNSYEVKNIPVGSTPQTMDFNKKTGKVYVGESGDKSIVILDGETGEILKRIPLGIVPHGILTDADKNKIYVSDFSGNSVIVINGEKDEIEKEIEVGATPTWMVLSGSELFVSLEGKKSLAVVDTLEQKLAAEIVLAAIPYWLILDKENPGKIFVFHKHMPLITIVDAASKTIQGTKRITFLDKIGKIYNRFAVNWEEKMVYFTQGGGNEVHLVSYEGKLAEGKVRLAAIIDAFGKISWQNNADIASNDLLLYGALGTAGLAILIGSALWLKKKRDNLNNLNLEK